MSEETDAGRGAVAGPVERPVRPLVVPAGSIAVPLELYDAWHGMCFGVDWNRGTHARKYRPKIVRLMRELEPRIPASVSDCDVA